MAPSHIRFGHFEYFHYNKRFNGVKQLADFIIDHHFSKLSELEEPEKYPLWLESIVTRTAVMIAQWQAVGFCHGVMNSDNMSILGLTIDYGPFGFIDKFKPSHICNHSDHQGRYAYFQQIPIGLWNLNALAHSLSSLIDSDAIKKALGEYEPTFLVHYKMLMRHKLGLKTEQENDGALIQQLLQCLTNGKTDYHWFFAQLSRRAELDSFADELLNPNDYRNWLINYEKRLSQEQFSLSERQTFMRKHNPKYVLRNYLAQQAIENAEQGDYAMVNELLIVLQKPYDEHTEFEHFAKRPPDWSKGLSVSCSS